MAITCQTFSRQATNRIVIERPIDTDDGYGGKSRTWGPVGDFNQDFNLDFNAGGIWAAIEPMSGREYFAQGGNQNTITHKFLIRYNSGFRNIRSISNYRISFDRRFFALKYIRNLDKDMKSHGSYFQEIMAEENAPDAQVA